MNLLIRTLLQSIAADAQLLAIKEERGQHWERELAQGLGSLAAKIQQAQQELRKQDDSFHH